MKCAVSSLVSRCSNWYNVPANSQLSSLNLSHLDMLQFKKSRVKFLVEIHLGTMGVACRMASHNVT